MGKVNLSQIAEMMDRTDKIITKPFELWLIEHGDERYPDWVLETIGNVMSTPPRDRRYSFSASSAGGCLRAQLFAYLGVPTVHSMEPTLQNLFSDGKWRHLRWQANLLAAGLIDQIEVPGSWRAMNAKGSMDGAGTSPNNHPRWSSKKFGFELKGVNPFAFNKIVATQEDQVLPAMKIEHKKQVHRYFLMNKDIELFVIIYECKATQQWVEWVIEPDDEFIEASRTELIELNNALDAEQLPKRLDSCDKGRGDLFRNECPFGTMNGPCSRTKDWPRTARKLRRVRK